MPHPAATILSLVFYGLATYCFILAGLGPCNVAAPISEPLAVGVACMVFGACAQVVLPLALRPSRRHPAPRRVRR